MTQTGKFSSYQNVDWYKESGGVEYPKAIADIHLVRDRKGYVYELDAWLLEDGTTRPSREPRVAALMPAYLRYGDGQPFTLREAVDASYDAGRHSRSYSYHAYFREGVPPAIIKEYVTRDHWVLANVSDCFSCATRCHLKIVLRDATIELEKLSRGVYMFHCNPAQPAASTRMDLYTYDEFITKYRTKFEREGIK